MLVAYSLLILSKWQDTRLNWFDFESVASLFGPYLAGIRRDFRNGLLPGSNFISVVANNLDQNGTCDDERALTCWGCTHAKLRLMVFVIEMIVYIHLLQSTMLQCDRCWRPNINFVNYFTLMSFRDAIAVLVCCCLCHNSGWGVCTASASSTSTTATARWIPSV